MRIGRQWQHQEDWRIWYRGQGRLVGEQGQGLGKGGVWPGIFLCIEVGDTTFSRGMLCQTVRLLRSCTLCIQRLA